VPAVRSSSPSPDAAARNSAKRRRCDRYPRRIARSGGRRNQQHHHPLPAQLVGQAGGKRPRAQSFWPGTTGGAAVAGRWSCSAAGPGRRRDRGRRGSLTARQGRQWLGRPAPRRSAGPGTRRRAGAGGRPAGQGRRRPRADLGSRPRLGAGSTGGATRPGHKRRCGDRRCRRGRHNRSSLTSGLLLTCFWRILPPSAPVDAGLGRPASLAAHLYGTPTATSRPPAPNAELSWRPTSDPGAAAGTPRR
jgi:hypothetical protein